MVEMRLLTMEAMFLRGVDCAASPLLSELLETMENTIDDFFLRPFGFLPSSSTGTCIECRVGATSPSLSDLESSLKNAGSRLTLCVSPRLRGVLSVPGDDNKASARWRSEIRMVGVLLGDTTEESRREYSQSDGVTRSGEEDRSIDEVSGWRGILSWM